MDILLSTNNTTLTFHTIEAVNINKERHHTCSIYMEWNTVFSPTYPTWALLGGTSRPPGETVHQHTSRIKLRNFSRRLDDLITSRVFTLHRGELLQVPGDRVAHLLEEALHQ